MASVRSRLRDAAFEQLFELLLVDRQLGLGSSVLGLGNVDERVAAIAHAFGMRVIAWSDRSKEPSAYGNVNLSAGWQPVRLFLALCIPASETASGLWPRPRSAPRARVT